VNPGNSDNFPGFVDSLVHGKYSGGGQGPAWAFRLPSMPYRGPFPGDPTPSALLWILSGFRSEALSVPAATMGSKGSHDPSHIGIANVGGTEVFTYLHYPTERSILGVNHPSWSSDGWRVAGAQIQEKN
jgi:hypothetical protein